LQLTRAAPQKKIVRRKPNRHHPTVMSHRFLLTQLCLITTLSASLPAADWVTLFDGQTLTGWQQRGGKAEYRVEDGQIIGVSVPGTPNSFLCSEKDYGDFILELEFKVDANLNSGIQFRSQSLPDYKNGQVHGYQCEIDPSDRGWTAGIYDEGRRGWLANLATNDPARFAFKQGDWNQVRIEAIGDRLRTFLNGVPAADLTDATTPKGFIALQVHSVKEQFAGLEIRWRNIRIQENPPHGSPETSAIAPPDVIVPADLEVRKVADGFKFTEGPALAPDGSIYFSDIPNENIHIFHPASGETTLHRAETGKANGLMFTPAGALLACEGGERRLTRQEGGSNVTVLTDSFDAKIYNAPNDLDIDGRGGLYFTDPGYGRKPDEMPLGVEGVYYATPDKDRTKPAKVIRIIDDLVRPNGVLVSNDKTTLYVIDNGTGSLWAYPIQPDGTVAKGRQLCVFDPTKPTGGDGLTSDQFGNLYIAAGGIYVIDPEGNHLGTIKVPEGPANCVFGPRGSQTLYITARTSLYAVKLPADGRR
jgi:sugar lactone lactonase YvrE